MLIGSTISLNTMMLGSTSFTPATLFSRGEQGVWLDPSDVANLNWLRNLLLWTQEFDNIIWSVRRATKSANVTIAPDGTLTADALTETVDNNTHGLTYDDGTTQRYSVTSGIDYTFSIFLKKGDGATAPDWFHLSFIEGFATNGVAFNLATGAVGLATGATGLITNAGNGWYRCSITATANTTTNLGRVNLNFTNNTNTTTVPSYVGSTTSNIFIWGAQVEASPVATPYQAITTVNAGVVERFPLNTMFQDRAGSTPVTTPGQLVGLRLDKSQQLAQGPELVANGNFSSGTTTGWTPVNATLSVVNGALRVTVITSGQGASAVTQISTIVGRTYRLTLTFVADGSTGNSFVYLGSTAGGSEYLNANLGSVVGTYTFVFTATATTSFVTVSTSTASLSGETNDWDNFSVREIAGNHAVAVSDATRGTYGIEPYGGRRNLLLWTTFGGAVAGTPGTAPTDWPFNSPGGTITSISNEVIGFSATAARQIIGQTVNVAANQNQVWGVTVASNPNGLTFHQLFAVINPTGLTSLEYYANGTLVNATVYVPVPNDRLTAVLINGAAAITPTFRIGVGASGAVTGSASFTRPQAEVVPTATSIASPYQRVTDQWNVTEAGVPTVHYLEYDNDAYVTPTINPSLNPPLGPELITNGDFSQGSTGWILETGWSVSGGVASYNGTAATNAIYQSGIILTSGISYRVTVTVTRTAGALQLRPNRFATSGAFQITASGTYSVTLVGSGGVFGLVSADFGGSFFIGTVDNISIQELVTDEVQVFAGVRKLSDAGNGTLLETSAAADSNDGAFFFRAPSGGLANYQFASRGTSVASLAAFVFTSPITNVVTSTSDISADNITIRANGAQVATSSTDQGTGSFGAYPLYIGARGGSSLFFRGRDYGIIVRFGPNLSNTTILDTEEWLGNKTGVLYVLWNGVWQDQYTWVDNLNWNDGV